MKRSTVWVLVAMLALSSAAAAEETHGLTYRVAREVYRHAGVEGATSFKYQPERPEGLELPELEETEPIFGRWSLPLAPDGGVWLAVVRSKEDGPYDRLYVDADCDGSLADETPLAAYRVRRLRPAGYTTYFGPVKVLLPGEDGPIAYHANITYKDWPQWTRDPGPKHFYLWTAAWYEGRVALGGRNYVLKLVDRNVNGTFTDRRPDGGWYDRVWVEGDGLPPERAQGTFIQLGGEFYRLEVARDGAFVRLSPAGDVPTGTLRLDAPLELLGVVGENGLLYFHPTERTATLPAGRYRPHSWKLSRIDSLGTRWEARGGGAPKGDDEGTFEVRAGRETEKAVGEPFVGVVACRTSGRTHRLSGEVRGRYGEEVRLRRNGSRPPAPKVRIRNADGTYDRVFRLEYG